MIRINQIKLNIHHTKDDILKETARLLKVNIKDIKKYEIIKQSIDARHKDSISYIYSVDVALVNSNREESIVRKTKNKNIIISNSEKYSFIVSGNDKLSNRPIVVGSGPAGLFCAYFLALGGYNPIILERGQDVDNRLISVNNFWDKGKLDLNSNVQFGEGGAGTFSDGKLNTMVKDKFGRNKEVLNIFCKFGAPDEITYVNKPHIGTDILVDVVKNIRKEIICHGGEFRFNTCLTNINKENNRIKSIDVLINSKETACIETDVLILAIGHSARDTFYMLNKNNIEMIAKPFAIGVRVEHPQEMINISQYGENYDPILPVAPYKVTSNLKNNRGVYSFCMCPGGYVVNASSEEGMLAVNGMSYSRRNSKNANSAIIVTVSPNDFAGNNVLSGIEFQRKLEKAAYIEGKGNIPIQLFGDFKDNIVSKTLGEVEPVTKGKTSFGNLRNIFPEYISQSLIQGITDFDQKIKGFARFDSILSGVESRTSSPVRIIRNEDYESNIKGIYPCGEGAGYAGGITSAAIDGMKIAEAIAKKYKPL